MTMKTGIWHYWERWRWNYWRRRGKTLGTSAKRVGGRIVTELGNCGEASVGGVQEVLDNVVQRL